MGMLTVRLFEADAPRSAGAGEEKRQPVRRGTVTRPARKRPAGAGTGERAGRVLTGSDCGMTTMRAVGEVRSRAARDAGRWGDPGRARSRRAAATSELVTNALVHTDGGRRRSRPGIAGRWRAIRVEVRDFVPGHPELRDHPPDGRNLREGPDAGAHLADAWGVRAHGVGKSGLVRAGRGRRPDRHADRAGCRSGAVRRRSAELPLDLREFLLQGVQPRNRLGVVLGGEIHGPLPAARSLRLRGVGVTEAAAESGHGFECRSRAARYRSAASADASGPS